MKALLKTGDRILVPGLGTWITATIDSIAKDGQILARDKHGQVNTHVGRCRLADTEGAAGAIFAYKGHKVEESEPFVLSVSPAGKMKYARIVKIDGEHEVCIKGQWELLGSVDRAKQLIDEEEVTK